MEKGGWIKRRPKRHSHEMPIFDCTPKARQWLKRNGFKRKGVVNEQKKLHCSDHGGIRHTKNESDARL
jgi:hypothetical protein